MTCASRLLVEYQDVVIRWGFGNPHPDLTKWGFGNSYPGFPNTQYLIPITILKGGLSYDRAQ